jgi:hypothetical protein
MRDQRRHRASFADAIRNHHSYLAILDLAILAARHRSLEHLERAVAENATEPMRWADIDPR